jgi:3-hydroxyacyl-CoA dehydrogenase/enoyl-CoA hydratase/3-hydroxybutyryl-CoA epimerase
MMEALLIGQEGVALPVIDKAACDFGMPMGPVELADSVGLDVALHVAKILGEAYGVPVPEELARMVEKKKLGRKTGEGFYKWKNGKPIKGAADGHAPVDLQDRLLLPMINESVAVLREKVVDDADLLDAGVIFGTGFAPFRGGPINYGRTRGIPDILATLKMLEAAHGERFRADEGWTSIGEEQSG